ncbi:mannose-6-phosphate isomerase [Formosa agariphila KMM 3901]|uniref:Phosphohexomutase n=1 Tax=Formosa agariphila (strain DSM 15362 / KCTC 12365 / LMG 23005 / KMM 3901 / M-2Alg 35-1) TaxID=1347342 RepID=T2KIY5_FORAG|nr:type I phosphomannose isomerase catalytic subunit [Formosa agariphila]CDF78760.1 mannose-6-phosphate isomerase [Formosa agariphila KMM 3901]
MSLYPLKFTPLYKYRIWGGEKLKTVLHKEYQEDSIGESWEISDVKGDETQVSEGSLAGKTLSALIEEFKEAIVGKKVYELFGTEFPLLIKFIDAKTPLSIQVHPSNEIAKERHNSFGKNEMWYVMEAEKDAELIVGFNQRVDKKSYVEALESGKILDVLNNDTVAPGDTYYIPTGRIHAIGAGVLLAEIQQTSDITYRIYDYERVDATTGKTRELHTEQAVDVIDYSVSDTYKTAYTKPENGTNTLVHSPYFKTNIMNVKGEMEKDYSELDSFVIYICAEGSLELVFNNTTYKISKGETVFLPASIDAVSLKSENADVLEVYY